MLTVSQQPQLYTPAYNAQTITALSNQIAITDFKYIVTVEINASGTIFTYDILQRPDGYLVYDPIELVKNYITRDYFNPEISASTFFGTAPGKSCTVQVKVKEYYSGAIQSTTTINYTAYDACLSEKDFSEYNYVFYILSGSTIIPLDPNPNVDAAVSTLGGHYFLHFFRGTARYLKISLFDASFTLVGNQTFTLDNTFNGIHYADIGYKTCIDSGLTPLDNYTLVWSILNVSSASIGTGSFTFKDLCTNHKQYALYYLTRTGKIAFKNFELLSQENVNKKTNTVRLNPSKITAGVYGKKLYDREVNTVSTLTTKQITLNTNWITETQSEQLEELFDSPIVYLKDLELNKWAAVEIKDSSYKRYKHINEALFNLTVLCEYSIQETRQRGV